MTTQAPENIFDGQEFFELMQAYRHARDADFAATGANFEAVKDFCKLHAPQPAPAPTQAQPRGWLITLTRAGEKHTLFCGHNCVGDYRVFDKDATSEAVYTHAQPAPAPELLEILRRFALATNDGDDQAQGTHYIAKDGKIRCKGSFLALIEEARAAIAKATGEAA